MTSRTFNRDFVKQFRQELVYFPFTNEQPYQQLLFRQFAGQKREITSWGEWLIEKMQHTPLVRRLIVKLEHEVMPDASALSNYAQELTQEFSSHMLNEPYTGKFYNSIVTTLDTYHEMVNDLQNDIELHLLSNLKKLFTGNGEEGYWDIDSNYTRKIEEVILFYLDNIHSFYSFFSKILQQEFSTPKGVQVTTQVADSLRSLLQLTEKLIVDIEFMKAIVTTWQNQMIAREKEELFN